MKFRKIEKEILKFHDVVVRGLSNGLSYTPGEEKTRNPEFWKRRSELFDWFEQCAVNLASGQPYERELKSLKRIAEEGYRTLYD